MVVPNANINTRRTYAPWAAGWRATLILTGSILLVRVIFLWFFCDYTLAEDEAFYWTWARRLGWCYQTKGPGVGWLIWLSTSLLGDTMPAIRAPSSIISALTMLCVAGLAMDVTKDRRAGFFAALCVALSPMLQLGAMVMTIDGPYALGWTAAAWAAWRGIDSKQARPIVVAGMLVGVATLFKYTSLLLVPGLGVYAWLKRREIPLPGARRAIVLASCGVAIGLIPPLIWNALHDWPTLFHLQRHMAEDGEGISIRLDVGPIWIVEFLFTQFVAAGLPLLLAIAAILGAKRERTQDTRRWNATVFILCCSLPPVVFYTIVSLFTRTQANWAFAAYPPLMVLAGEQVLSIMDDWAMRVSVWKSRRAERGVGTGSDSSPQTAGRLFWLVTIVGGVVVGLAILNLSGVSQFVQWLKRAPVISSVIPSALYVPVGRVQGADHMAEHAQELYARLVKEKGEGSFIMTRQYGRAALFEFYMRGHPKVYCANAYMPGGAPTQYDFWAETDLRQAKHLIGKDALLVGGRLPEEWAALFEKVELLGRLDGDSKPDRPAYYGRGFRGVEAAKVRISPAELNRKPTPNYPMAPREIPMVPVPPPVQRKGS